MLSHKIAIRSDGHGVSDADGRLRAVAPLSPVRTAGLSAVDVFSLLGSSIFPILSFNSRQ